MKPTVLIDWIDDIDGTMVPIFSSRRSVADSASSVLDARDDTGDDSVSWLKWMEKELWGLQGHDFWGKFKRVCRGLCMLAPEFKQESDSSSIAKTFIETLNSVILRDVADSFWEKRKRGDDGYNPYDKRYFYTWKYTDMYEKIFQQYTNNPSDARLAQELQWLKEKFLKDLDNAIDRWEQAESLEYMAELHSNIPSGLFTPEGTKERAYFEFKSFNWLICALQKMNDAEQMHYLQNLPFFPSDWPFTIDRAGLEKMRDEVAIAWARLILSNSRISPQRNVYHVASEIDSAISRLWVTLEKLWLQVYEQRKWIGRVIGKWEVVWYELNKKKN